MTDLYGRFILTIAVIVMLAAVARAAFGGDDLVTPAQAIARAVEQRVGGDVTVDVTALQTPVGPEHGLRALPEPGGRTGIPMRFVLMHGAARRGVALATVKVNASYARASRAIGRDETIGVDAIERVRGEMPSLALGHLPAAEDVVGSIARRDIAAGEALTQAVVQVPPAVRAGDAVTLTVVVGHVRVTAKGKAAGSGYEGDFIRVTPDGGKALRARITGRGTLETVQ